jgi:hypothetical protein
MVFEAIHRPIHRWTNRASAIPPAGLPSSERVPQWQKDFLALAEHYVSYMDAGHAKVKRDEVRAHLGKTYFAWIGGSGPESAIDRSIKRGDREVRGGRRLVAPRSSRFNCLDFGDRLHLVRLGRPVSIRVC